MNTLIHSEIGLTKFTPLQAAIELRDSLVLELRRVQGITAPFEQERAVALAVSGRRFVKDVAAERLACTKPLDRYKEAAITLERELCEPVQQEMERVAKQVAAWQVLEQQRVAELNRVQAIEVARQEAEMMARNAEARAAAGSIQDEATLNAAVEAERLAKEQQEAFRAEAIKPDAEVVRAKGSSTRKVMRFEVTDLHALYKAMPQLVRLEFNAAAARALVVSIPREPIPGLTVTEEISTSFRA